MIYDTVTPGILFFSVVHIILRGETTALSVLCRENVSSNRTSKLNRNVVFKLFLQTYQTEPVLKLYI